LFINSRSGKMTELSYSNTVLISIIPKYIMKLYLINLINALTLIVMGLWGYFASSNPSFTALIPVLAGIILLLFTKGIRDSNKTIAHIAVVLTLLILIALLKPLTGSISRGDTPAIIRIILMMLTSVVALILYIKSFVAVRKQREKTI
jgi:hypothetical protein